MDHNPENAVYWDYASSAAQVVYPPVDIISLQILCIWIMYIRIFKILNNLHNPNIFSLIALTFTSWIVSHDIVDRSEYT